MNEQVHERGQVTAKCGHYQVRMHAHMPACELHAGIVPDCLHAVLCSMNLVYVPTKGPFNVLSHPEKRLNKYK
jgi:hypothetical protein